MCGKYNFDAKMRTRKINQIKYEMIGLNQEQTPKKTVNRNISYFGHERTNKKRLEC